MRETRRGDHARGERGASAVEFALLVPVFMLLVFGVLSYGVMLSFRQSLSQATTEGARAAATFVVDAQKMSNAQGAISSDLANNGIACSGTAPTTPLTTDFSGTLVRSSDGTTVGSCSVSKEFACNADGSASCMTVTLTYNYRQFPVGPIFPGLGLVTPNTLSYSATVRVS